MISEIEIIEIIRNLENNDIGKAKDIVYGLKKAESPYEEGYVHALRGLIASCENKEADSVFFRLINDAFKGENLEEEIEFSRAILNQNFRPTYEIGFEHAWEFIFSYFSGSIKTGLDKYQE
ncbi:MAG: hypothetical protein JW825_04165 [Candidatus Methanofastidiosa archaeon]|nr:hypothetical protein [Candidatus Methanofastidiosa archaeon]